MAEWNDAELINERSLSKNVKMSKVDKNVFYRLAFLDHLARTKLGLTWIVLNY